MTTQSTADRSQDTRRRVLMALARMAVVAAVVLLVIWKFDMHAIHDAFAITSWPFLAGAIAANFASVAFKGLAWKGVVDGLPALAGQRSRYRDLISPLFVGFLFNTVLAARVGEFAKVLLTRRRMRRRKIEVQATSLLGSVVAENLISTLTWVALVIGIGVFLPLPRYAWVTSLVLGAVCIAVILVALVTSRGAAGQIAPWLKEGSLWARLTRATTRMWGAVQESHVGLRDRRLLTLVAGASFATWLCQWAGIYLTLYAFGLERVGWGGAGLLLVTVTLAQAFPVLPGNLLVFQAAAVLPLTASYGVGAAEALAFSIVLQGTEAIVGVAVGFLCLIGEGTSFGQLRRDAREEERQAHQAGAAVP